MEPWKTWDAVAAAFECTKSMLKMNGVAHPCCSVHVQFAAAKRRRLHGKSVVMCSIVQPFSEMHVKALTGLTFFADHSFRFPANKICLMRMEDGGKG